MAASAVPSPISSRLGRSLSPPALLRLVFLSPFLFLIAALVISPSGAADLLPPASFGSAPSSLPEPADSPPAPPSSFGGSPSSEPAPAPHSGSNPDSGLPPFSSSSPLHSPPAPPSSESSPSPSPLPFSTQVPGDTVPVPPALTPAAADLEKLRSTPQTVSQQEEGDDSDGKGGMSAGKKAGVALGVIFAAALAVLAFTVYRKRSENLRRASRYAGYSNRRDMQVQMV